MFIFAVKRAGFNSTEIAIGIAAGMKWAGYRRTETAARMKEAESSFSLEKFYDGKMKNRIPEIV